MKLTEIITAFVAIYGAVLSTIAIVKQLQSDRARVKLTVSRDMELMGDLQYQGMTLTILTATNVGRRPVTITTLGANCLYPTKNFMIMDSRPPLPCEITEGKYILSFMDQSGLDSATIDRWVVWDSHGRAHKLQEASWFKHWKSAFQRKQAFRKLKAKAADKQPE